MEEQKKSFIECECGTHLLQITHEVEYFEDTKTKSTRVRQEFQLAMFTYGTYHKKPGLRERLRVIWNYFRTGKMHSDQILMTVDEAQKLADFILDNIVPTVKG
jgi:hypothetical protein